MAKKKDNDKLNSLAPTPTRVVAPTRQPAIPTRSRAAAVTRTVTVKPGPTAAQRAASNVAQRNIQDQRNAAYGRSEDRVNALARVPVAVKKPALAIADKIDAPKKPATPVKEAVKPPRQKSSLTMGRASLHSKPEREALRSPEKVRAPMCKSRPKNNRPSKGSGGGKQFKPWC